MRRSVSFTVDKNVKHRGALNLLQLARLDPERVYDAYPHELSGGMKQRTALALSVLLSAIPARDPDKTRSKIQPSRSFIVFSALCTAMSKRMSAFSPGLCF